MRRINALLILLTIIMLFIIPVSNIKSSLAEAAVIKISKTNLTIIKGKSSTLKVTGTKNKITWTSSNNKIASVTSKGAVKGESSGTATITAKIGSKSYNCKVTVLPIFNIKNQDIINELNGRYVTWNNQEFIIKSEDITSVEIGSIVTSKDSLTKTVPASIIIDRTVVKLKLDAKLVYSGSVNKWAITSCTYEANIYEYNISGTYLGNGRVNCSYSSFWNDYSQEVGRLIILNVENMKSDGVFTGTVTLSANADSPTADTNIYAIKGGVNTNTGVVTIVFMEHISGTDNWSSTVSGSTEAGLYIDAKNEGISANNTEWNSHHIIISTVLSKEDPNKIPIK